VGGLVSLRTRLVVFFCYASSIYLPRGWNDSSSSLGIHVGGLPNRNGVSILVACCSAVLCHLPCVFLYGDVSPWFSCTSRFLVSHQQVAEDETSTSVEMQARQSISSEVLTILHLVRGVDNRRLHCYHGAAQPVSFRMSSTMFSFRTLAILSLNVLSPLLFSQSCSRMCFSASRHVVGLGVTKLQWRVSAIGVVSSSVFFYFMFL